MTGGAAIVSPFILCYTHGRTNGKEAAIMTDRIRALAERAVKEGLFIHPPHESPNPDYAACPEPLRVAYSIRDFFARYPIRRCDGELLTDAFYTDGIPAPGCAYRHTGHTSFAEFFARHSDYQPNNLAAVDWNHYCNDYPTIVCLGMRSYLPRITAARERFAGNEEKLCFLDALEIVCFAIRDFAARYGSTVPFEPAAGFAEAVEAFWFAFLLMPDSLGRLDQLLYPFYRRDLDAGVITEEKAREYLAELFVKVFAYFGPGADRSGDNTFVIGGYTPDGEDGTNELTLMIAEIIAELPTWRPQVYFRVTKKTPSDVLLQMVKLNMRTRNIAFVSDEVRFRAYEALGIPYEDHVNYTMIGCNEWAIEGKSNTGADGYFNVAAALEEVLYFQRDKVRACGSFEAFYALFADHLALKVSYMCDLADMFYLANSRDCNVLSSLMIRGCIEKATSLTAGGALYNESVWSAMGLINTADALSSIRYYIYETNQWTFDGLFAALDANWNGYEVMRRQCMAAEVSFGCANEAADATVNRLIHDLDVFANRRKPMKGGKYVFGCLVGYCETHVAMGLRTRATPDGRYNGDAFTGGITTVAEHANRGPTAYLISVSRLDFKTFCGAIAVNIRLEPGVKDCPEKVAALFETYLRRGGYQLQPDYVSADTLRDAQRHPAQYKALRVRVTGFTGFFVRFDEGLQNELIERTEHTL